MSANFCINCGNQLSSEIKPKDTGKICPYCHSVIKPSSDIATCSNCGITYHKECWDENGGCAVYGCTNEVIKDSFTEKEPDEKRDVVKSVDYMIMPKLLSIVMLLFALADNPYIYYQILRWVVGCTIGFSAYLAYENKKVFWAFVLGIIAIIFNPITPFHLDRDIWAFLNIVAAFMLILNIIFYKFTIKKVKK